MAMIIILILWISSEATMSKYNQSDLAIANICSWFHSNLNVPQARKKGGGGCPLTYFLNTNDHSSIYLFIFLPNIYWAHAMSWTLRLQRQKKDSERLTASVSGWERTLTHASLASEILNGFCSLPGWTVTTEIDGQKSMLWRLGS